MAICRRAASATCAIAGIAGDLGVELSDLGPQLLGRGCGLTEPLGVFLERIGLPDDLVAPELVGGGNIEAGVERRQQWIAALGIDRDRAHGAYLLEGSDQRGVERKHAPDLVDPGICPRQPAIAIRGGGRPLLDQARKLGEPRAELMERGERLAGEGRNDILPRDLQVAADGVAELIPALGLLGGDLIDLAHLRHQAGHASGVGGGAQQAGDLDAAAAEGLPRQRVALLEPGLAHGLGEQVPGIRQRARARDLAGEHRIDLLQGLVDRAGRLLDVVHGDGEPLQRRGHRLRRHPDLRARVLQRLQLGNREPGGLRKVLQAPGAFRQLQRRLRGLLESQRSRGQGGPHGQSRGTKPTQRGAGGAQAAGHRHRLRLQQLHGAAVRHRRLRAAVMMADGELHQLAGALLADQPLRPRRGEIALDLGERLLCAIGLIVLALHPLERPLHAQLRLGRLVRDDGKIVLRAGKLVELGGRLVDAPGHGVDLDAADGVDLHRLLPGLTRISRLALLDALPLLLVEPGEIDVVHRPHHAGEGLLGILAVEAEASGIAADRGERDAAGAAHRPHRPIVGEHAPRRKVGRREVGELGILRHLLVGFGEERRGIRLLLGDLGEPVVGCPPGQGVAEGGGEFFSIASSSSAVSSATFIDAHITPS